MKTATIEKHEVVAFEPATTDYLRIAAAVVLTHGVESAKALLDVPDRELGMHIKEGILRVYEDAQSLFVVPDVGTTAVRVRRGKLKRAAKNLQAPDKIDLGAFESKEKTSRQQLLEDGQLVAPAVMWERLKVTRQALHKAIASNRMFTLDVGSSQYLPTFYLSEELDRRKLEKVTQLLGDLPGWSKWQFFTRGKASLNNLTPLEALKQGMFQDVKSAAEAFAER